VIPGALAGAVTERAGAELFRELLRTSDGYTTFLLQAYHGEPLIVEMLSSTDAESVSELHQLLDPVPATTTIRSVRLRGSVTGCVFADATCVLVPENLPSAVRDGLATTNTPLGALLYRHGVPVFRRVLPSGIDELVDARPTRRSIIYTAQGPAAAVHERFDLTANLGAA